MNGFHYGSKFFLLPVSDTSLSSESSELDREAAAVNNQSFESPTQSIGSGLALTDPSQEGISCNTADIARQLVELFPPAASSPQHVQMQPYFDCIAAFVDRLPSAYMQAFLGCLGCPQQVPTSNLVFPKPQRQVWSGMPVGGLSLPSSPWQLPAGAFVNGPPCGITFSPAHPLSACDFSQIAASRILESAGPCNVKELDDAAAALVDLSGKGAAGCPQEKPSVAEDADLASPTATATVT